MDDISILESRLHDPIKEVSESLDFGEQKRQNDSLATIVRPTSLEWWTDAVA